TYYQDIVAQKYRIVVLSPELLLRRNGFCETLLWTSTRFTDKLQNIIFDEGHCIKQWGTVFRLEYGKADNVFWRLKDTPIYISSATIPPEMMRELDELFGFTNTNRLLFKRANDRTNITYSVR
ncbi:hypothetical protein K474DRAFT_1578040, partial [Panus rudis PR-1116 ss-1]